jgi:hypothetical protein
MFHDDTGPIPDQVMVWEDGQPLEQYKPCNALPAHTLGQRRQFFQI